ncbi:MAG: type II toxin-antitoxin system RelE/ParE family toxin [Euryarchaeota archaeon]|nr:type II toxin-antitoxin system RelE/ParE family toxin [Euryarchaeota archaeon]
MTFEIGFTEPAMKELRKLEHVMQARIVAALERIRIRPKDFVTKLVGDPRYKLRVGDYRILIEIDYTKQRLLVHRIRHRKNVYNF